MTVLLHGRGGFITRNKIQYYEAFYWRYSNCANLLYVYVLLTTHFISKMFIKLIYGRSHLNGRKTWLSDGAKSALNQWETLFLLDKTWFVGHYYESYSLLQSLKRMWRRLDARLNERITLTWRRATQGAQYHRQNRLKLFIFWLNCN